MREFVLLDAAIWRAFPRFDALTRAENAIPIYADLPSANASHFGPWLVDADAFCACLPGDEPRELPWRYGVSRLLTDASRASVARHLESQRCVAMAEGDRYYLRYADTRALDALARVLATEQVQQLKGPIGQWRYLDRFGDEREFGAGLPAGLPRHAEIVLSDEQSARLLEQELASALAGYLDMRRGRGNSVRYGLSADQYAQVEKSAAFILLHGIEPLEVQQHIAAVAVETLGAVFTDARFLAQVESSRSPGQWRELLKWRVV